MARSELRTANFIDLETSPEASAGIIPADVTFTTLTAGSNNGGYFSFADSEMLILYNDTGGAATFTIPLTEPTNYNTLGVTFNDKTFPVDNGDFCLVHPDSRYQDDDGYINLDCDVAGKFAVVKRYTIK